MIYCFVDFFQRFLDEPRHGSITQILSSESKDEPVRKNYKFAVSGTELQKECFDCQVVCAT